MDDLEEFEKFHDGPCCIGEPLSHEEAARRWKARQDAAAGAEIARLRAALAELQQDYDTTDTDLQHWEGWAQKYKARAEAAEARIVALEAALGRIVVCLPERPTPDENGQYGLTFLTIGSPIYQAADDASAVLAGRTEDGWPYDPETRSWHAPVPTQDKELDKLV